MADPLYVGIDAGGTTSRLLAGDRSGTLIYESNGPGANLQRLGLTATADVLAAAIAEAADHSGREHRLLINAGVSGAGRSDEAAALATACRSRLNAYQVDAIQVVHDGIIALEGAFSGESGVILIAGTGSLVLIRTSEGEIVRAGGWGAILGDDGSGYAIGRAAVRAIAHAIDADEEIALHRVLAGSHPLETRDDVIRTVYRDRFALQTLAPLVLEEAAAGDATAEAIVDQAAHALIRQLTRALRQERQVTPRVALIGGLTQHAYYRNALATHLRAHLPGWAVVDPRESPVQGALRMARGLAGDP